MSIAAPAAVVNVGTGFNVSVGDQGQSRRTGSTISIPMKPDPMAGEITLTEGALLNAATQPKTGLFTIGQAGTGTVTVGVG